MSLPETGSDWKFTLNGKEYSGKVLSYDHEKGLVYLDFFGTQIIVPQEEGGEISVVNPSA